MEQGRKRMTERGAGGAPRIFTAPHMHKSATMIGGTLRQSHKEDAKKQGDSELGGRRKRREKIV